jgi:hypothetical protein
MKSTDKLLKLKPVKRGLVKDKRTSFWLNYMPASEMQAAQFSGYTYKGEVYISEALRGRSKHYIIQHELYHIHDKKNWGGYFGKELRANIVCGLKNPIGLCFAIGHAIRNHRLKVYGLRLLTNLRH